MFEKMSQAADGWRPMHLGAASLASWEQARWRWRACSEASSRFPGVPR